MKKIGFILRDIRQQIGYEHFMSTVVLLALAIGNFFLLFGVNGINDLRADARLAAYREKERLYVVDVSQMYEEAEHIEERIAAGIEKGAITDAAYYAIARQIVYGRTDSFSVYVNACSRHYLELDGNEIVAGRMFTLAEAENGENVCMLIHRGVLESDGVGVGDTISFLGTSYRVIGILRAPKIHGGVVIPYRAGKDMLSVGRNQYQMMIYGNPEKKWRARELAKLMFPEASVEEAKTGTEMEAAYLESVNSLIRRQGRECGIIIAFTGISMFMLLLGKTMDIRYRNGVRMAVGADRKNIFLQNILQNLILMLTSLAADLFLYKGIAGKIRGANPYLRLNTLWEVTAIGIGMLFVISFITVWYSLHRCSISMLLRRRV